MTDLPEGWLTHPEAELLRELAAGKVVLEMGAWKGRSTVAMASTAHVVFSVDWHRGDPETGSHDTLVEFFHDVRGLPNVVPIIGRFETVFPMLAPKSFDLCFIDGAHDPESVTRDYWHARNLVKEGGVVACHDWSWSESVKAALPIYPLRIVDSIAVFGL